MDYKVKNYTEQLNDLYEALKNESISHQDYLEYYIEEYDGKTYVQFYIEIDLKDKERSIRGESIMVEVAPEKVTVSLSKARMGGRCTIPEYEQIPNIEYGFEHKGLVQIVNESIDKMVEVYQTMFC